MVQMKAFFLNVRLLPRRAGYSLKSFPDTHVTCSASRIFIVSNNELRNYEHTMRSKLIAYGEDLYLVTDQHLQMYVI